MQNTTSTPTSTPEQVHHEDNFTTPQQQVREPLFPRTPTRRGMSWTTFYEQPDGDLVGDRLLQVSEVPNLLFRLMQSSAAYASTLERGDPLLTFTSRFLRNYISGEDGHPTGSDVASTIVSPIMQRNARASAPPDDQASTHLNPVSSTALGHVSAERPFVNEWDEYFNGPGSGNASYPFFQRLEDHIAQEAIRQSEESLMRRREKEENLPRVPDVAHHKAGRGEVCCIACADNIPNVTLMPCKDQNYCAECISKWRLTAPLFTCPSCRATITSVEERTLGQKRALVEAEVQSRDGEKRLTKERMLSTNYPNTRAAARLSAKRLRTEMIQL